MTYATLALALAVSTTPPDDAGWLNGANRHPASPIVTGPLTWSLLVEPYYGYSFNTPADHTVFPTTSAPRHNEFNLNHAFIGAEVTGVENVLGKLVLQTGNYVDTLYGADPTITRGAYNSLLNVHNVQQAYAGYNFNGTSWITGIFLAYIGMESYLNQENWNFTHALTSDFTPYYLVGTSLQRQLTPELAGQLWLVNGWQTVSKYDEGFGGGWQLNWRPNHRLSVTNNVLAGSFDKDATRLRFYTDNSVQWLYALRPHPWIRRLALAAVADLGYETAGTSRPATYLGGGTLCHRVELDERWALNLRTSAYSDPQQLVALTLPNGASLPNGGPLLAQEATATLDYKPSEWLLYRLELRHDFANIPYIAGPGGITRTAGGPDLVQAGDRITFNTTLRF